MSVLKGLRVAVTRPADHGDDRLVELLTRAGASPSRFPLTAFLPPADERPLRRAAARAQSYDWIVFASRRAVGPFVRCLSEGGLTPEALSNSETRICAVGPATAEALRGEGLVPAVVPGRFSAEGLLEAIFREVGDPARVRGLRILIPRATEGRDLIPDELTRAGASVEVVSAYRTVEDSAEAERLAERVVHGSLDALAFTASSSVRCFSRAWKSRFGEDSPSWLAEIGIVAIGPSTGQTLRDHGFDRVEQASTSTLEGVVQALEAWAERVRS